MISISPSIVNSLWAYQADCQDEHFGMLDAPYMPPRGVLLESGKETANDIEKLVRMSMFMCTSTCLCVHCMREYCQ